MIKSFILSILFLCVVTVEGQTLTTPLTARPQDLIVSIDRPNSRFSDIMKDLIEIYEVPIGVEESADYQGKDENLQFDVNRRNVPYVSPCNKKPVVPREIPLRPNEKAFSIVAKDAKLGDVLDQIVAQMGNYRWSVENGVVNLTPISNRSPELTKYLDLKIATFKIIRGSYSAELQLADMQSSVLQSPESFAFIKSNNFIFMQGPVRWSDSPLPEFTAPDGSSIRETLNIMAKAKRGGWIIRLFRSKDYKFAIVLNI